MRIDDLHHAFPHQILKNSQQYIHVIERVLPMDKLGTTFRRMGTETKQGSVSCPFGLRYIDAQLEEAYQDAISEED
jgi:hypothetical protein